MIRLLGDHERKFVLWRGDSKQTDTEQTGDKGKQGNGQRSKKWGNGQKERQKEQSVETERQARRGSEDAETGGDTGAYEQVDARTAQL